MKMLQTKERWIVAAVIALMAIIVFINLGKGEIQPWDEGLYAIRAKSILHFNDFWDQTAFSSGGLYSSTYPPLTIWFMAGAMSVLGENEFSVRLFSVLCSIASLIFIFLLSKRIVSYKYSLLAVILTGATFVWNKFSREGMTDIPLTFFFILSFWAVIKLIETEERKRILLYLVIFILGFASALMTKIVISFLPLLFVLLLFIWKNNKKWHLLIASIAAIALASPWYIYMIASYGEPFYKALFVPHIYSIVETNSPKLGTLYYLNQLLVSNPFILYSFIFIILLLFKKIRTKVFVSIKSNYIIVTSALWFMLTFIILSLSKTKMLHYSVYMVPPAIILVIVFIENIRTIINNNRIILLLIACIIILMFWSFSPELRVDIKTLFSEFSFSFVSVIFILFIGITLAFSLLINYNILQKISGKYFTIMFFLLTSILLINIFLQNTFYKLGHSYGAEKAAGFVLNSNENTFIYLYHEATSSEFLNPQLAWYTKGIMNKWVTGKSYQTYPLPLNANLNDTLDKMKELRDNVVIYYKPREEEFARIVLDKVSIEWKIVDYCDRYIVFRRNRK